MEFHSRAKKDGKSGCSHVYVSAFLCVRRCVSSSSVFIEWLLQNTTSWMHADPFSLFSLLFRKIMVTLEHCYGEYDTDSHLFCTENMNSDCHSLWSSFAHNYPLRQVRTWHWLQYLSTSRRRHSHINVSQLVCWMITDIHVYTTCPTSYSGSTHVHRGGTFRNKPRAEWQPKAVFGGKMRGTRAIYDPNLCAHGKALLPEW